MSELAAYSPVESNNNLIVRATRKTIKDAGIASFLLVSTLGATANVTPTIEPTTISTQKVNVTSAISRKESLKSFGEPESHTNIIEFNVFNPSRNEYDNNKRYSAVLLNGSILEGEYPMHGERRISIESNKFVTGNLHYLGHIPVKERVDNAEIHSVKAKDTEYNDFITVQGNLEFIGHIPKKPRI